MNTDNDQLDIDNLSEVLTELQNEMQSVKGDVEKLRLAKLIDKLELWRNELNHLKQDVHQLQQDIAQVKGPIKTKKTHYKQSEYSKLQKMLRSIHVSDNSSVQSHNRK
ncbi:hypothetical protein ACTNEO_08530 [Gracilibacillus sp. HCP3S3_G5_1]|uniref:hypothetical protein n=1 Tax=unclassified Gracilibacillus TaxID=2625209 RepID=UPI003F8A54A1